MPRSTPRVPSYRFHKASRQAVVTLAGKDIYLGPHGTPDSHQKYDAVIAEWLANHKQKPASSKTGAVPDSGLLTVDGLFVAYWRFCQAYYVDDSVSPRKTPSGSNRCPHIAEQAAGITVSPQLARTISWKMAAVSIR